MDGMSCFFLCSNRCANTTKLMKSLRSSSKMIVSDKHDTCVYSCGTVAKTTSRFQKKNLSHAVPDLFMARRHQESAATSALHL